MSNFIKTLSDQEKKELKPIPFNSSDINNIDNKDRKTAGMEIIKCFLHDGKIRGLTKDMEIYEHYVSFSNLFGSTQFFQQFQCCFHDRIS